MKLFRNSSALTLAEVLVAIFVFSVGIGGTLLFFTHALKSAELAGDLTTATAHAEYVLEDMYARHSLFEMTTTDWSAWIAQENITSLPNEEIKAVISNEFINPVDVHVSVNWMRRQRPYNISLDAKITQ